MNGPWVIGPIVDNRRRILGSAVGPWAASVVCETMGNNPEIDRLIMAAPNLLNACKDAREHLRIGVEDHGTDCECATCSEIAILDAAIKRAGQL